MRILELFTIFTFNSIFQGVPLISHFSHYTQIIIYSITFNLRQTSTKSVNTFQSYDCLNVPTETSEWAISTHLAISSNNGDIGVWIFRFP